MTKALVLLPPQCCFCSLPKLESSLLSYPYSYTADLSRCPPHLQLSRGSNVSDSVYINNYAESTPYQLQAELDDASVVSEDPKYGWQGVDTAVSPASEVSSGIFFISALNTIDGGRCRKTDATLNAYATALLSRFLTLISTVHA